MLCGTYFNKWLIRQLSATRPISTILRTHYRPPSMCWTGPQKFRNQRYNHWSELVLTSSIINDQWHFNHETKMQYCDFYRPLKKRYRETSLRKSFEFHCYAFQIYTRNLQMLVLKFICRFYCIWLVHLFLVNIKAKVVKWKFRQLNTPKAFDNSWSTRMIFLEFLHCANNALRRLSRITLIILFF